MIRDWLEYMAQPLQQFEGKYEILAKIGEGGMGSVYKVRHRLLDEVRVIKVMRPQVENQEQVKDRFQREARIAVKLRHPNIAQMYDFSVDDSGTAYNVMEFVDGITLQTVLKKSGPPSLGLVLEITQQALQALEVGVAREAGDRQRGAKRGQDLPGMGPGHPAAPKDHQRPAARPGRRVQER